ncbi:hypothetical protein HYH02_010766 [Chlamydomonas schloesseri]|uniref:Serine/threonine-protein phosphatase n=1 Tax=Chlamydomonas schloesseri TaxID=2026947 RepID=A0A835W6H7_9CHLO|nr:hypothetical protein HYH02_010766 [Chlamydomonas schloesseri]|eukprot:KAG2438974.1 hypothetical protein HYH02_010766 [Chlamydomonas schloesseri]
MLDLLLQPSQTFKIEQVPDISATFTAQECAVVIKRARLLLAGEDSLLYVAAPCRVVSDLHGQFADLMHIMGWCGAPDGNVPWVFLGDYVDRTDYGCEVMLLLYSLKIKWPDRIFLLRGNHEIEGINGYYGFKGELTSKWGLHHGTTLYNSFNDSFAYMPLAAIAIPPGYEGEVSDSDDSRQPSDSPRKQLQPQKYIPDRYLMMHGGIGRLEWLSEIAAVKRPLRGADDEEYGSVLVEVVWSDPAPNDNDTGFRNSSRDNYAGGIICYGADRVEEFCKRNHITAILRGHEVIQQGMEVAFGGRLLTFFSAPNYAGRGTNDGVILNLALVKDQYSGHTNIEVQPMYFEAMQCQMSAAFDDAASEMTDMEPQDVGDDDSPLPSDEELLRMRELLAGQQQEQQETSVYERLSADQVAITEVLRKVMREGALKKQAQQQQQAGTEGQAAASCFEQHDQRAGMPSGTGSAEMFWWSTAARAAEAANSPFPADGSASAGSGSPAAADAQEGDGDDEIVFGPAAARGPGHVGPGGGGRSPNGVAAKGAAADDDTQRASGTFPALTAEALCTLNITAPTGARLHELRNRWWLQNHAGAAEPQPAPASMGVNRVLMPPPGFEHVKIVKAAPPPPPGFELLPRPPPGFVPEVARQPADASTVAAANAHGDGGMNAADAVAATQQSTAGAPVGSGGLVSEVEAANTSAEADGFRAALAVAASQLIAEQSASELVALVRKSSTAGDVGASMLPPEAGLFHKPCLCVALQSACFDDEDPWDMPDMSKGPYVQRPYNDAVAVVPPAPTAAAAADSGGEKSGMRRGTSGFGSPVNSGGFGSPVTSPTTSRSGGNASAVSARLDAAAGGSVDAPALPGNAACSPPPASTSPGAGLLTSPLPAAASPPAAAVMSPPQTAFAAARPSMLAPLLMQTVGAASNAEVDGDQAMQDMNAWQPQNGVEDDTVMRDAGGSGSMDMELSAETEQAGGGAELEARNEFTPAAATYLVEKNFVSDGARGARQQPASPQRIEVPATLTPAQGEAALSFPPTSVQPVTGIPFQLVPVMVAPVAPRTGAAMMTGAQAHPMPIVTGSWSPSGVVNACGAAAAAASSGGSGGLQLIPVPGTAAAASPAAAISQAVPCAPPMLCQGLVSHSARTVSDPLPSATTRIRPVSMGSGGVAAAAAVATSPLGAGSRTGAGSPVGGPAPGVSASTGSPNRLARRTSEGSASTQAVIQHAPDPRRPTPPRMCRDLGVMVEDEASQ